MEVYNVPDQGLADTYLIQGAESYLQPAAQFGSMYNEGAHDYIVDQGLYYPPGTSYGYICTGYEPTTDWEEQHYTVAPNESMPYVYYSPSYGYTQSPYNPYNPYIPGAVIGADGSIISPQQYYAVPSYENPVTSASYVPVFLQQRPDAISNGSVDSYVYTSESVNKANGLGSKNSLAVNIPNSSLTTVGGVSSRRISVTKMPEGSRVNAGTGKQHLPSITSGGISSQTASQISQIRDPQGIENGLRGKALVASSQLKTAFTSGNGPSAFESDSYAQASVNKAKPNMVSGRNSDDERVAPDTLIDQNRESRMTKSKNHLVVKAYTTRAGSPDAQGNIIISRDQYNRVDFPVEYANAKFFVIKSYSEDDVHKSIKYNVWSSTPNGNKKLNAAYEDTKRIPAGDSRGCPIFLFFSVNASGQFCGVAEMAGPVDFHRDMDFWQQDKWSGSFPVKWHFIKDLPNPNFRHIILENNENKPVTNSRDTQEISYTKGLDMLKIYKNYTAKTSLLDDFMYYENRQWILHGERSRIPIKSYENPYLVPVLDPPRKIQSGHHFPPISDINGVKHDINNLTTLNKSEVSSSAVPACSTKDHAEPKAQISSQTSPNNLACTHGNNQVSADGVANAVEELKLSRLSIYSDEAQSDGAGSGRTPPSSTAISNKTKGDLVNVVTIGSMPVKVMDTESSGFLTVGTIPLDPKTLLHK